MVYEFLGINWVIVGYMWNELWAWVGICKKKTHLFLIPLTIFWMVWKERNVTDFYESERDFIIIRDKEIHTFGYMILGHDINEFDDLEIFIDHLINM